jgi:hypothetical protein
MVFEINKVVEVKAEWAGVPQLIYTLVLWRGSVR